MHICEHCEAEFEIVHSGPEAVEFCPFCGEDLNYEDYGEVEDDIEWDE